jgi:hypothetical protein
VSWALILLLAAGSYGFKAAGLLVFGASPMAERMAPATLLIPPAMFAALIMIQTFSDGRTLVLDARVFGLLTAVVAVRLRAPFVVVVGAAMLATALARAIA